VVRVLVMVVLLCYCELVTD